MKNVLRFSAALMFVLFSTSAGAQLTVLKNTQVLQANPKANLNNDEDIWADAYVIVKGKTAICIGTAGGPITGTHWDFGDGSSAPGDKLKHVYNTKGLFSVCFVAEGKGAARIECRQVMIGK